MQFHPIADTFPLIDGQEFDELAGDIRTNGLLEPIWTYDEAILDGRNRYRACLEAGVEPKYRPYLGNDPVGFVVAMNLRRRHLNESQRAMVASNLANLRWGQRADRPANLPVLPGIALPPAPITQARAAEMLNVGERSVRAAREVQQSGAPELIREVQGGRVAVSTAAELTALPREQQTEVVARGEAAILAAAKEIRQQRTEQRRGERLNVIVTKAQSLDSLSVRYPVILADPPWEYEFAESENRAIENQYPTMALPDIKVLPVSGIATDDALLFLWATPPKLEEALEVLREWGFSYRSQWIWVKDRIGMGYYARQQHEIVLIGRRGDFPVPAPGDRPSSVFHADRGLHSVKPAEVHERIERMYPDVPRIELFSRQARDGWAAWGNQAADLVAW